MLTTTPHVTGRTLGDETRLLPVAGRPETERCGERAAGSGGQVSVACRADGCSGPSAEADGRRGRGASEQGERVVPPWAADRGLPALTA